MKRILYHHRTRATDAQRVHIREIIHAFRSLGHHVEQASLADAEKAQPNASREAKDGLLKRLLRSLPFAAEAIQLAYNLFAIPWLIAKILLGRFDFVYERYSLFTFAGVAAARLTGRPIIIEVNSPLALEQTRQQEIQATWLAMRLERAILNGATKVIVVSGPLKRIMIDNGVAESKLILMPNGVNLDHLNDAPLTDELRRTLNLEGRVVVGFVGWFRKWHGLDLLLRAFHQGRLEEKGVSLLLVGDGPSKSEAAEYVAQHGLQRSVVFAGPVPHEQIPSYLHLIDIAVQPAANEYCCPMKVIEYMGLAKPVLGPRQQNISELLTDGKHGLLFTPGDVQGLAQAMCRLVDSPSLRASMGGHCLETVHRRRLLWIHNAREVARLAEAGGSSRSEFATVPPGKSSR